LNQPGDGLVKITVIGTGYVGLVSGACLASLGNEVLCLDLDASKIEKLRAGIMPIYEPGLEPLVAENVAAGRLRFTTDIAESVHHGDIQIIAVGTPPQEDGGADVKYVLQAARNIGREMTTAKILVTKSTVPVGTSDDVLEAATGELKERGADLAVAVVSNPEFLREGSAVKDFLNPDRVIVGSTDSQARATVGALYSNIVADPSDIILTDARSSELTKYAANAMLAARISFMNELANLADSLGANIDDIRKGVGRDPRIGPSFLNAGTGYGGMCFPKDVKALVHTADKQGELTDLSILAAIDAVNERQKKVLVGKIRQRFGDLTGKTFALWGIAFKPHTDDIREAPAIAIIEELIHAGAAVRAFDPVALENARKELATSGADFSDDPFEILHGSDALIIATEWPQFGEVDLNVIRESLKSPIIFDGRNMFEPAVVEASGLEYYSIGRGTPIRSA
jgi:UDPglucose 6-dehydrogenase